MNVHYRDSSVTLHAGDCLDVLRTLPDASVDAVVTDPPYGLEFMGRDWDAPWRADGVTDVNADAGFGGGGFSAVNAPSFTGSTNPKCLRCKGTRRGRRDGTAVRAVCVCEDGGQFPNVRAVEMRAFAEWCELWTIECLRVLKPGGHLLAFGGTRTWHRLTCAIEDAGFEVRDSIAWMYGSGFPKSLNLVGPDGERTGWGTALKPGHEPIVVARKLLAGTVAANVLAHGTGALNIDKCRTPFSSDADKSSARPGGKLTSRNGALAGKEQQCETASIDAPTTATSTTSGTGSARNAISSSSLRTEFQAEQGLGRWPANVILDESQADALDEQSGASTSRVGKPRGADHGDGWGMTATGAEYDDAGGASRFFYTAKADASERVRVDGIAHPTVKPLSLMRWLVRLVTPPGGTVLEPFAGSGTTVEACILEGFRCVAIEREETYLPLIVQRIHRRRDPVAAVRGAGEDGGLFDLLDGGVA